MIKRSALLFCLLVSTGFALPQGGTVTGGASTISQQGNTLNINQTTNSSVINWTGFDIGAGEHVNFNQPGAGSLSINRISGNASQIEGSLSANGQVWLLNPNGVMFGQGAQVNVGGLLATTGSLNDDGTFGNVNANGGITNNGTITASQYAALVAASVNNTGSIAAPHITLAAAPSFAIDNNGLIAIAPGMASFAQHVANSGKLNATNGTGGGTVSMLTQAGLASVVNNNGVVESNGVNTDGGVITLTGGSVANNGTLSADGGINGNGGTVKVIGSNFTTMDGNITARGGSQSGNGGNVEVSSKGGMTLNGTVITTAANGKTGTLLIDPDNINIVDGTGGANDGSLPAVGSADGAGTDFIISEQALEGLGASTNILLQATNNITVAPLTDHVLNLTTTGSVVFTAGGNFSMDALDTIATGGAGVTINAANITVGAVNTSAGAGAIVFNTTGGTGTITANGNLTTANAAITLNGDLSLASDVALTSGNGAITFNGDVTGAHTLTLAGGSGALSFKNLDTDTLTITSGGAITLNGTLTTANALNFSNAGSITLGGDSTITASSGNVILGSANTVNGNHALGITGDSIGVGAAVGTGTALTTFTANAASTLALGNVKTSGQQTYTGATGITLGGNLTGGGGDIAVNNNATLANDVTVASTGGNINFAGTVNGAHSLTANAGVGTLTFGNTIGNSAALTTLAATGGTITSNGVKTTGAQTYTGPANVQGTYTASSGNTTFTNAVTLGGDTVFDTTGGTANVNFNSTVDGFHSLTYTGGSGLMAATGAIGGTTALNVFSGSGNTSLHNLTTTGRQTFAGATALNGTYTAGGTLHLSGNTTLGADTTFTSGGNMTLGGTTTGAHTLTLQAGANDITFNTFSAPTLVLASGNDVFINTSLASTNGLDFTNVGTLNLQTNATINAGTGNLLTDSANAITGNTFNLTTAGNTVTLNAVNGVGNLTLGGTSVVLNGAVNTTGNVTANAPVAINNNVTTAGGNVTFNNPVTLGADSTIATGGGNFTTNGTVNGAHSLSVDTGTGSLTANAAWGGTTPLANVTLNAAGMALNTLTTTGNVTLTGTTTLNSTVGAGGTLTIVGALTLNNNLHSNGALTIDGPVTLAADSTLSTGGAVGDDLTLTGGITGDHNLTLDAGLANLALTGDVAVNGLTFAGGNQLSYGGGTIQTNGALDFSAIGNIFLGGDTTLHAGAGSTGRADIITTADNNILATTPGVDLTVYGDNVTLHQVGNSTTGKLNTFTVDANLVQLEGSVFTLGAQTINATQGLAGLLESNGGDITLNTPSLLLADVHIITDGGNVYFNRALGGDHNLIVDSGTGDIYVNAALGGTVPLASFQANGARIFLSSGITTAGALTINVPVTLAANGMFATNGGALTINSTLDGLHTLSVDTNGGDITLVYGAQVDSYIQQSPAGNVNWDGIGLVASGDVTALQNSTLNGKLTTGGNAYLQAAQHADLNLDVQGITYGGGSANFSGSIGGYTGQHAAQLIHFSHLNAGPVTYDGYNLPVPSTYSVPQNAALLMPARNPNSLYSINLPADPSATTL